MLRYLVGRAWPHGTLIVNVVGCLAIGFIVSRWSLEESARGFWVVGLLGGFTTFSACGLETLNLLREGAYLPAAGNVAAQLLLGVGAAAVGFALGKGI